MSKNIFCLMKTCALIQKAPNTALNFWLFRRQSTLNSSQTWFQSINTSLHSYP